MAKRRHNPRLVKIHRSYTVEEVARLYGIHKNTVRNWFKNGMVPIDEQRPTLVHGLDLQCFLEQQRRSAKQPCPPGYLYCLKCRKPQKPACDMADYVVHTETVGNLRGICPDCETIMNRRVSLAKIDDVGADLEISFPEDATRIRERTVPTVNCDFRKEGKTHEKA